MPFALADYQPVDSCHFSPSRVRNVRRRSDRCETGAFHPSFQVTGRKPPYFRSLPQTPETLVSGAQEHETNTLKCIKACLNLLFLIFWLQFFL